jgi:hypothetical protein
MLTLRPPLLAGVLLLVVNPLVCGQSQPAARPPKADTAGAKKAALEEFRQAEISLDRRYTKCPTCKGKGLVKDVACTQCGGDGQQFKGDDYQAHVDEYVAYCLLQEKHAAVLADDAESREHIEKNRTRYFRTIKEHLSESSAPRRGDEPNAPAARKGARTDVYYNQMACDLAVALKKKALGHGIAFSGRVLKLRTAGEARLAEVRIDAPSGEKRTCFVPLAADSKWAEGTRVRVLGKIIEGADTRKAFQLGEDDALVQTCAGTE